ncbi:MAG TPA: hypothetical protein VFG09_15485 [Thermodesulfovibrionales bacterium]|nr:hypothetical protein [Thermodesulfovibrionales bacterium]
MGNDDILGEVIAVEKEIQRTLDREKGKSREWLDGVRKETEEKFAREEEKIKGAFAIALEQARKEADERAAMIVRDAEANARGLDNLEDDFLKKIIEKGIRRILPDGLHDSQDVKG